MSKVDEKLVIVVLSSGMSIIGKSTVEDAELGVVRDVGQIVTLMQPTPQGVMKMSQLVGLGLNAGPIAEVSVPGDAMCYEISKENVGSDVFDRYWKEYKLFLTLRARDTFGDPKIVPPPMPNIDPTQIRGRRH